MTTPTGDHNVEFEFRLEAEVEAELNLAESSRAEEMFGRPASEWLFDPADTESYEVGLGNLLGAVEALGGDAQPHHRDGNEST